jgi:apolipoprotein N-acyltransferase
VDYAMVSEVPTGGVRTVYSLLGDWFAWACLAALAVLMVLALRRRTVRLVHAQSQDLRKPKP